MLLKDLCREEDCGPFGALEIEELTIDSRTCRPGSLYFAIPGTRVDGHDFLENARQNGAVAAVVERKCDCAIPQIVTEHTRRTMSLMAARFYDSPADRLKLIGVTGTNGKTSTTFMLRAIMHAAGRKCGVIGTNGLFVDGEKLEIPFLTSTTPDPIELQHILAEMLAHGADTVAMEVTAHALDLEKVAGLRFTAAGFTNLTQDHLDYFGTMDNYRAAKEKLFPMADRAIVNADDEEGRRLAEKFGADTYSIGSEATLKAAQIEISSDRTDFVLSLRHKHRPVRLNTVGLFNVSNALCAVGCALAAGVPEEDCLRGLAEFSPAKGRFESLPTGGRGFSVIVDYAHTPDGMENVLSAINAYKTGRLITVFGCGGDRDTGKRPKMGAIGGKMSDLCILTTDNPRSEEPDAIIDSIEQGIKEEKCPYERITDRREAIRYALSLASRGDVVAILGKGDEDYMDIKGKKIHFSDREIAEEWLEAKE